MPPKTETTLPAQCPSPVPTINPPISVLNDDVLFHIFSLNADMRGEAMDTRAVTTNVAFRSNALFSTWRTSQVSRRWRALLIGSPTIWGNLIDLSLLRGDRSKWRDEVLRRSRSSLLSVKGFINLHLDYGLTWYRMSGKTLCALLQDTWPRLRSIDIAISYSVAISDATWLDLFRQESRFLESFSVDFLANPFDRHPFSSRSRGPLNFRLFSDVAPTLRKFNNNQFPIESFAKSSWLSQIRVLHLCIAEHHPALPTVSQILHVLAGIPCLEVLSMTGPDDRFTSSMNGEPTEAVPFIHFPYLDFISFERMGFEVWITFLACILPKPGCSLSVNPNFYLINPSDNHMLAISPTLSRYSKSFISSRSQQSKRLGIQVVLNEFSFFDEGSPKYHPTNMDTNYFRITFLPHPLLNFGSIFSALPHPILAAITELHLILENCCFTRNASDPQFIQFLSSFTLVETLITEDSCSTLATLLKIPDDAPMIFPSLRTLKMVGPVKMALYSTVDHKRLTEPSLLSFLRWRKLLGVPIQTLVAMDTWRIYEDDLKRLDFRVESGVERWGQYGSGIYMWWVAQVGRVLHNTSDA